MQKFAKFCLALMAMATGAALPAANNDLRSSTASGEPPDAAMDLGNLVDVIRAEVRPEEAMNFMRSLYSTDRWFTFPKFQATAAYLDRTMKNAGLKQVELLGAP